MRKSWTISIPALENNLGEGLLKPPRDKKTARSISYKLFLQFLAHVRVRSMLLKRQAASCENYLSCFAHTSHQAST